MLLYFKSLLLILLSFSIASCKTKKNAENTDNIILQKLPLQTGAQRSDLYLPRLEGKRIGLIVNPTSMIDNMHLVDYLLSKNIKISKIFAPEHGFRGDGEAGEKIKDGKDAKTGLSIVSLHGTKYKPNEQDMENIDILLFDIQDVGVRFYTYTSTLLYAMEACAENKKTMMVFDRPNPNGNYTDGPVLDNNFKSFLGLVPIPLVHGVTVGEFAKMCNEEGWLTKKQKCNLQVIPCQGYTHDDYYEVKIAPSPNLKTMRSILLYPSICLFEGTDVSLGRGTATPFEIAGHPSLKGKYNYSFTPAPNAAASNPPQNGKLCYGTSFQNLTEKEIFSRKRLDLTPLIDYYKAFPSKDAYFLKNKFIDKLAGTDKLRLDIIAGKSEAEIRATWQADLDKYNKIRAKYLMYP